MMSRSLLSMMLIATFYSGSLHAQIKLSDTANFKALTNRVATVESVVKPDGSLGTSSSKYSINGTTGSATFGDLSTSKVLTTGASVTRSLASHFADRLNVLDFGADSTGVKDSAPAFYSAMLASGSGGTIYVPLGTYRLDTIPWGTNIRNIRLDAVPGIKWVGAGATMGAGMLSNYWILGHPLTNPYNATSGPIFECYNINPGTTAPGTNATQCLSEELVGPHGDGTPGSATGATGLLHYIGLDTGDSIDNFNTGENVNIVTNVHNADNPVSNFGAIGLEVDVNVDVACRKKADGTPGWTTPGIPSCAGNTGAPDNSHFPYTFMGMFVESGGAGGPFQAPLGGIGMQVKRGAGAWSIGYSCLWADSCFESDAYNHAMLIHTTYGYHTPNDPYCAGGSDCPVQGGIYFDNAPYWGNTLFAGSLLANNSDALVISRYTDTSPAGRFINFTNKANTQTLFSVDVLGGVTYAGGIVNNSAGTYRSTFYRTAGSSRWEQGVAGTAESGSNVGSEWYLNRYSDTGALLDAPVQIYRTDGIVRMSDGAKLGATTVAALPVCNAALEGGIKGVTDAPASATWNQTLSSGGGTLHTLAYCNGTNWTVH
jgi:hypothetical protein